MDSCIVEWCRVSFRHVVVARGSELALYAVPGTQQAVAFNRRNRCSFPKTGVGSEPLVSLDLASTACARGLDCTHSLRITALASSPVLGFQQGAIGRDPMVLLAVGYQWTEQRGPARAGDAASSGAHLLSSRVADEVLGSPGCAAQPPPDTLPHIPSPASIPEEVLFPVRPPRIPTVRSGGGLVLVALPLLPAPTSAEGKTRGSHVPSDRGDGTASLESPLESQRAVQRGQLLGMLALVRTAGVPASLQASLPAPTSLTWAVGALPTAGKNGSTARQTPVAGPLDACVVAGFPDARGQPAFATCQAALLLWDLTGPVAAAKAGHPRIPQPCAPVLTRLRKSDRRTVRSRYASWLVRGSHERASRPHGSSASLYCWLLPTQTGHETPIWEPRARLPFVSPIADRTDRWSHTPQDGEDTLSVSLAHGWSHQSFLIVGCSNGLVRVVGPVSSLMSPTHTPQPPLSDASVECKSDDGGILEKKSNEDVSCGSRAACECAVCHGHLVNVCFAVRPPGSRRDGRAPGSDSATAAVQWAECHARRPHLLLTHLAWGSLDPVDLLCVWDLRKVAVSSVCMSTRTCTVWTGKNQPSPSDKHTRGWLADTLDEWALKSPSARRKTLRGYDRSALQRPHPPLAWPAMCISMSDVNHPVSGTSAALQDPHSLRWGQAVVWDLGVRSGQQLARLRAQKGPDSRCDNPVQHTMDFLMCRSAVACGPGCDVAWRSAVQSKLQTSTDSDTPTTTPPSASCGSDQTGTLAKNPASSMLATHQAGGLLSHLGIDAQQPPSEVRSKLGRTLLAQRFLCDRPLTVQEVALAERLHEAAFFSLPRADDFLIDSRTKRIVACSDTPRGGQRTPASPLPSAATCVTHAHTDFSPENCPAGLSVGGKAWLRWGYHPLTSKAGGDADLIVFHFRPETGRLVVWDLRGALPDLDPPASSHTTTARITDKSDHIVARATSRDPRRVGAPSAQVISCASQSLTLAQGAGRPLGGVSVCLHPVLPHLFAAVGLRHRPSGLQSAGLRSGTRLENATAPATSTQRAVSSTQANSGKPKDPWAVWLDAGTTISQVHDASFTPSFSSRANHHAPSSQEGLTGAVLGVAQFLAPAGGAFGSCANPLVRSAAPCPFDLWDRFAPSLAMLASSSHRHNGRSRRHRDPSGLPTYADLSGCAPTGGHKPMAHRWLLERPLVRRIAAVMQRAFRRPQQDLAEALRVLWAAQLRHTDMAGRGARWLETSLDSMFGYPLCIAVGAAPTTARGPAENAVALSGSYVVTRVRGGVLGSDRAPGSHGAAPPAAAVSASGSTAHPPLPHSSGLSTKVALAKSSSMKPAVRGSSGRVGKSGAGVSTASPSVTFQDGNDGHSVPHLPPAHHHPTQHHDASRVPSSTVGPSTAQNGLCSVHSPPQCVCCGRVTAAYLPPSLFSLAVDYTQPNSRSHHHPHHHHPHHRRPHHHHPHRFNRSSPAANHTLSTTTTPSQGSARATAAAARLSFPACHHGCVAAHLLPGSGGQLTDSAGPGNTESALRGLDATVLLQGDISNLMRDRSVLGYGLSAHTNADVCQLTCGRLTGRWESGYRARVLLSAQLTRHPTPPARTIRGLRGSRPVTHRQCRHLCRALWGAQTRSWNAVHRHLYGALRHELGLMFLWRFLRQGSVQILLQRPNTASRTPVSARQEGRVGGLRVQYRWQCGLEGVRPVRESVARVSVDGTSDDISPEGQAQPTTAAAGLTAIFEPMDGLCALLPASWQQAVWMCVCQRSHDGRKHTPSRVCPERRKVLRTVVQMDARVCCPQLDRVLISDFHGHNRTRNLFMAVHRDAQVLLAPDYTGARNSRAGERSSASGPVLRGAPAGSSGCLQVRFRQRLLQVIGWHLPRSLAVPEPAGGPGGPTDPVAAFVQLQLMQVASTDEAWLRASSSVFRQIGVLMLAQQWRYALGLVETCLDALRLEHTRHAMQASRTQRKSRRLRPDGADSSNDSMRSSATVALSRPRTAPPQWSLNGGSAAAPVSEGKNTAGAGERADTPAARGRRTGAPIRGSNKNSATRRRSDPKHTPIPAQLAGMLLLMQRVQTMLRVLVNPETAVGTAGSGNTEQRTRERVPLYGAATSDSYTAVSASQPAFRNAGARRPSESAREQARAAARSSAGAGVMSGVRVRVGGEMLWVAEQPVTSLTLGAAEGPAAAVVVGTLLLHRVFGAALLHTASALCSGGSGGAGSSGGVNGSVNGCVNGGGGGGGGGGGEAGGCDRSEPCLSRLESRMCKRFPSVKALRTLLFPLCVTHQGMACTGPRSSAKHTRATPAAQPFYFVGRAVGRSATDRHQPPSHAEHACCSPFYVLSLADRVAVCALYLGKAAFVAYLRYVLFTGSGRHDQSPGSFVDLELLVLVGMRTVARQPRRVCGCGLLHLLRCAQCGDTPSSKHRSGPSHRSVQHHTTRTPSPSISMAQMCVDGTEYRLCIDVRGLRLAESASSDRLSSRAGRRARQSAPSRHLTTVSSCVRELVVRCGGQQFRQLAMHTLGHTHSGGWARVRAVDGCSSSDTGATGATVQRATADAEAGGSGGHVGDAGERKSGVDASRPSNTPRTPPFSDPTDPITTVSPRMPLVVHLMQRALDRSSDAQSTALLGTLALAYFPTIYLRSMLQLGWRSAGHGPWMGRELGMLVDGCVGLRGSITLDTGDADRHSPQVGATQASTAAHHHPSSAMAATEDASGASVKTTGRAFRLRSRSIVTDIVPRSALDQLLTGLHTPPPTHLFRWFEAYCTQMLPGVVRKSVLSTQRTLLLQLSAWLAVEHFSAHIARTARTLAELNRRLLPTGAFRPFLPTRVVQSPFSRGITAANTPSPLELGDGSPNSGTGGDRGSLLAAQPASGRSLRDNGGALRALRGARGGRRGVRRGRRGFRGGRVRRLLGRAGRMGHLAPGAGKGGGMLSAGPNAPPDALVINSADPGGMSRPASLTSMAGAAGAGTSGGSAGGGVGGMHSVSSVPSLVAHGRQSPSSTSQYRPGPPGHSSAVSVALFASKSRGGSPQRWSGSPGGRARSQSMGTGPQTASRLPVAPAPLWSAALQLYGVYLSAMFASSFPGQSVLEATAHTGRSARGTNASAATLASSGVDVRTTGSLRLQSADRSPTGSPGSASVTPAVSSGWASRSTQPSSSGEPCGRAVRVLLRNLHAVSFAAGACPLSRVLQSRFETLFARGLNPVEGTAASPFPRCPQCMTPLELPHMSTSKEFLRSEASGAEQRVNMMGAAGGGGGGGGGGAEASGCLTSTADQTRHHSCPVCTRVLPRCALCLSALTIAVPAKRVAGGGGGADGHGASPMAQEEEEAEAAIRPLQWDRPSAAALIAVVSSAASRAGSNGAGAKPGSGSQPSSAHRASSTLRSMHLWKRVWGGGVGVLQGVSRADGCCDDGSARQDTASYTHPDHLSGHSIQRVAESVKDYVVWGAAEFRTPLDEYIDVAAALWDLQRLPAGERKAGSTHHSTSGGSPALHSSSGNDSAAGAGRTATKAPHSSGWFDPHGSMIRVQSPSDGGDTGTARGSPTTVITPPTVLADTTHPSSSSANTAPVTASQPHTRSLQPPGGAPTDLSGATFTSTGSLHGAVEVGAADSIVAREGALPGPSGIHRPNTAGPLNTSRVNSRTGTASRTLRTRKRGSRAAEEEEVADNELREAALRHHPLTLLDTARLESRLPGQHLRDWFTWCQRCRHGGHAQHMKEWFTSHNSCPVTHCSCVCSELDTF